MGDDIADLERRAYLTVREGYDMFVTRNEHTAAMQSLRTDLGGFKTDLHEVKTDVRAMRDNQLPRWFIGVLAVIVSALAIVAPHVWK